MKSDIILSGVGGQGILSIATIIGEAALDEGLHIKQAEVHGMSQRGGDVQSNLRLSSDPIRSDLIPYGTADLILSLEPMEALRYLPYLSEKGWVVTHSVPFINIPNYPDPEKLIEELNRLPHVVLLDVEKLAKECGAPRSSNMCCSEPHRTCCTSESKNSKRESDACSGAKGKRSSRPTSQRSDAVAKLPRVSSTKR